MSDPYNLLSKPWIPVGWRSDATGEKPEKVGIRKALESAHKIQCISHTSPFIEFGLYRLLITIVLDAYIVVEQRPTIGKMRNMLDRGNFDQFIFEDYLKSHSEHFDLWAKNGPFLQRRPANEVRKQPIPTAVVKMFAAVPSGNNVTLWHHFTEEETRITEEVAAQFLTTVSPWNFKIKPGEARTLAGDPPMYAIVLGKNLFETIILNLPRPSGRITAKQERENGPAWRTPLDLSRLPKTPTFTQGFTWPVRVIKLENEGAIVAKAINQAAYNKPTDKAKKKGGKLYDAKYGWRDPSAGVATTRDAIAHIKAKPEVPIWRDAIPLFLVASEGEALRDKGRRSRPEVVTNALRVLNTLRFRVAVYGMRKKSGAGDVKVEEWFRSVLTLPTEVARDDRLSYQAINAFNTTQKVADALQTALRMLRPPVKSKKGKPPPGRADLDALAHFWQSLELVLSDTYLKELGSGDPKNAEVTLLEKIEKEGRYAFRLAAGPQRRTPDGLFRVANASNWFERRLSRLLRKPVQEKTI